ncbi:MAG: TraR/DksA family transcriptional regulator [Acidobacteria bacterium]|nr:TraR/DksA family transcriptional regulator [Acidobacteriota bacterium]
MRAAQKKKIQKQLLERRRELVKALKQDQAEVRRGDDDGPLDLADTATELWNQEFNYSLSEHDRAELAGIDEGLARLEDGSYGECEECGEKISEARLKALPWAPLCIACQKEKEELARRNA